MHRPAWKERVREGDGLTSPTGKGENPVKWGEAGVLNGEQRCLEPWTHTEHVGHAWEHKNKRRHIRNSPGPQTPPTHSFRKMPTPRLRGSHLFYPSAFLHAVCPHFVVFVLRLLPPDLGLSPIDYKYGTMCMQCPHHSELSPLASPRFTLFAD